MLRLILDIDQWKWTIVVLLLPHHFPHRCHVIYHLHAVSPTT
jgi:hypothetical protein